MTRETTCTVCSANIPLETETKVGDTVYCSYCGARLRITKIHSDEEGKVTHEDDVQEDWES